jgi:hypothetical protein
LLAQCRGQSLKHTAVAKKPQNSIKSMEKVGFCLSGLPNVGTIRSSFPKGRLQMQ